MNPRRRTLLAGVALVAAIFLVYARTLSADFIWDDDAHITANPAMQGAHGLKEIWTSAKANYSPLTMTTFWLEHASWGLAPRPFHAVTILFHAASAVMLWLVLRRLLVPGAWLGAAIWALHPVQVESVAWICELKNTQSAFFFLVAVWYFVRWLQTNPALSLRRDYGLAVVAGVLAMLSKSSTVMLPIVLGLAGWWLGRRRLADARWLAPFFVVSLLASAWTIWEQKVNSMASGAEWSHGLAARCVIAGKIIWFYLGKLAWPDPLIFIYPRWSVADVSPLAWVPLVAAVAAGAWLLRHATGRGQPAFIGFAYFVISLFPVLGFFDVFFFRYSFVGDHLQYLANLGPLVLVGAGLGAIGRRFPASRLPAAIGAGALLILLGLLTWRQTRIYRSNFTLWQDTVARNPQAWIARVNWGVQLVAAGRPAEAVPHYEAALRLKPQFKEIEVNLGAALMHLGRPADAIPHFEKALDAKFGRADALNGLGFALDQAGRTDEAIVRLEEALRLNPKLEAARYNLGNALVRQRRLAPALEQYATVVRDSPQSALYRDALARTLLVAGRVPEAVEQYRAAATIAPDDYEAQYTLAMLLLQAGGSSEAVARAAAAVRSRPASPEARFMMGAALLAVRRLEEAVPFYQEALRLRPDYFEARTHLAAVLYQLGRPAEAVPQYEALLRAQPQSADAHNNLASSLLQLGRVDEALQHCQTAVQLRPDNPETRTNWAFALRAAGRSSEALAQCQEALRLRPGFEPARRLQADLEAAGPKTP